MTKQFVSKIELAPEKQALEMRDLFPRGKLRLRHRVACFALSGQMENDFGPYLAEESDLVPSAAWPIPCNDQL